MDTTVPEGEICMHAYMRVCAVLAMAWGQGEAGRGGSLNHQCLLMVLTSG